MAEVDTLEPELTAAVLTEQQLAFFEVFGFLRLPGLLVDEFPRIEAAFEEVHDGTEEDATG